MDMEQDKAAIYRRIFGKRIQQLRQQRGWNLTTFARQLETVANSISATGEQVKIPASTLAGIEQGRFLPSVERLFLLANLFNTSVSFLLGEVTQDGLNKSLTTKLNTLPPTSKEAVIHLINTLSDNAMRGI